MLVVEKKLAGTQSCSADSYTKSSLLTVKARKQTRCLGSYCQLRSSYLFKPAVFLWSTYTAENSSVNRNINLPLGRTICIFPNFRRIEWNHQNNGSNWFATCWDDWADFTRTFLSPSYTGAIFEGSSCGNGVEPFVEVERVLSAVCFTPSTVDSFLFAANRIAWSFFSRSCRKKKETAWWKRMQQ